MCIRCSLLLQPPANGSSSGPAGSHPEVCNAIVSELVIFMSDLHVHVMHIFSTFSVNSCCWQASRSHVCMSHHARGSERFNHPEVLQQRVLSLCIHTCNSRACADVCLLFDDIMLIMR